MKQTKEKRLVHNRNLQTLSAFFENRVSHEEAEQFAETAAQSMKHREQLFKYIEAHTNRTMLYGEQNQVADEDKSKESVVTPMQQAKRRNKNLSMPMLDVYEYFTDRGNMEGDTLMANSQQRLEGMAFFAVHTARQQSPYEKRSSEMKTQALIRKADSAGHFVNEKKEAHEMFTDKECTETLENCKKLSEDGAQPRRTELTQLADGAMRAVQKTATVEGKAKLDNTISIKNDENTRSLAEGYLLEKKMHENFLNLGNMVYDRDRDKVNRLATEDFALNIGKAAALLVLGHSRGEDKTLAEIIRINEQQEQDMEIPTPIQSDDVPDNNSEGGEVFEQQTQ